MEFTSYEGYGVKEMAVGCLHILLGRAVVDFPGTSCAAPSRWVVVSLGHAGPLVPSYKGFFPYKVIWNVWQDVVVPVMADPTNHIMTKDTVSLRVPINVALLNQSDYSILVKNLEAAFVRQLQEVGMIHPEADPVVAVTTPTLAPGEPIVLPDVDPLGIGDDTVWSEGHPRLVYPIVE